jgi:hypothetical protein
MEKRRQAEKQMSTSQFISLKKKYDEDENNRINKPYNTKRQQNETSMFLQRLERRIQQGQEKA